ncbi:nitric oxide reductase activation protein NorD [Pseudogulbenkiania subflava]|uniref:Nitric oxide reductase NorD protein n=1 Tax=Pseudogulbenkiania subflava DSM 22618 TaxID=1123014 RepID=A0A1Y6BSK1_9NEIS|nr:VWA domain-containing protein [Pseudogulbenkiania subflava]SMF27064.1 nitric oxide reductase NorD protein [Pseudogulbenkiania subflava DSM 22618]
MEDIVGGWWDRLITRAAYRGHPQAAVTLAGVTRLAPPFFRAMGGDPALVLRSTVGTEHGARRSLLERVAGIGEKVELAWSDRQALYLPEKLDLFPSATLNRALYFWLMALAAEPAPRGDWLTRNRLATQRCLERMPGLAASYHQLVGALLALRPDPARLAAPEAAVEQAIRQALQHPEREVTLPEVKRPPQPVPLWLHPAPPTGAENGGAAGDSPADDDSEHKARESAQKRRRYRAQRIVPEDKKDGMLMVFRAESLFTWDEYVKVNRHNDEDEDEDNAAAAEDMNKLSIAADGKTRGSRLKFDLDLPSAEYDDTPLGPGLLLPEWDWKRQRLIDDHCRLLPMHPRDASPAPLPDRLLPLARRLRRQFQALAPERTRKSGETNGPDIDLDRVIRFMAERQSGVAQGEPGLYQAWPPGERNLACLLLADLSLSTESWVGEAGRVIDVIKDSLLLFAEALSASGDAFGLYGFSSLKRHEVRYLLLKDFADAFDDAARGRILALRPGYYTRMGAAIRQSARILAQQPAQRRLLLIVSDGKPNDMDHYEGRYGIEDTRQAILEARRDGVTPFCVTIDREAGDYLPHLFGSRGYVVVQRAETLPQVLTTLYAQLTR